jgi:uncharacterized surface protein with fasciclin (FAS1) repeats
MNKNRIGGKDLSIKVEGGSVLLDTAKVVKTDAAASNSVIHVIDTVMLPKSRVRAGVGGQAPFRPVSTTRPLSP